MPLLNPETRQRLKDALKIAQKKINMAHSKGVLKANNASRKVAHISKAVSSMN